MKYPKMVLVSLLAIAFLVMFSIRSEAAQFRLGKYSIQAKVNVPYTLKLELLLKDVPHGKLEWVEPKGMPRWLHLNAAKGVLEGTPQIGDEGDPTIFQLFVIENGKADSAEIWTVASNHAYNLPEWDQSPIREYACVGQHFQSSYDWAEMAFDPYGKHLTISVIGAPQWLKVTSGYRHVMADGTPQLKNAGMNKFFLRARNSKGFTDNAVLIDVQDCK